MLFKTEKVAISGTGVGTDQHRQAGLMNLIVNANCHAGQVLTGVDLSRGGDSAVDDVVGRAQRHSVSEEVGKQFDDPAQGTVADQDQSQDELANPRAGNRQVEQDSFVVVRLGGEGLVKGVVGDVKLLVDELAADLVLLGQFRDGLTGKGVQCQLAAL